MWFNVPSSLDFTIFDFLRYEAKFQLACLRYSLSKDLSNFDGFCSLPKLIYQFEYVNHKLAKSIADEIVKQWLKRSYVTVLYARVPI